LDYSDLIATYEKAATIAREEHVPVLVHVNELTQPQGHLVLTNVTKMPITLAWEEILIVLDKCDWMMLTNIASQEELELIDVSATRSLVGKSGLD
jgi:hypothetical protein